MFKASLDNLAKYLPFVLVGFSIPIFITVGFAVDRSLSTIALFPCLILLLISIIAYYYSPLFYDVEMDTISIIRKAGKFFINRKDIKGIRAISDNDLGQTWRMMGNGGVFGYTGWFSSSRLGKMRWFVSQRKNYVLIVMNNDSKFLVSPDDVDGFLKATQS